MTSADPAQLPAAAAANSNRILARRRRHELEFLPAALEIVESPVSPIGRAVAGVVILFFVIALVWAYIGRVDVIATAPGKIIPTDRAKIIQPFEIGTVRAIHVEEGQRVAAGDVLIELDPTTSNADVARFERDLVRAGLDAARLRALLPNAPAVADPFAGVQGATPIDVQTQHYQLEAQRLEQEAKLAAIGQQLSQKRAEQEAVRANIAKLNAQLPLVSQRADIRRQGLATQFGSKLAFLDSQQQLVEMQNELIVQRHHFDEAGAAIETLQRQHAGTIAEYNKNLFADLAKAETQGSEMTQDLIKARDKTALQIIKSPVNGFVQQLALHTIGGVVTPAQQLMVVVPSDSKLEIEATVENKDIGFVQPGQPVEIKVETFSFTHYGLLHGTVEHVSRDAVPQDKPATPPPGSAQQTAAGAEGQSSEHLAYIAKIALQETAMPVDGKLEPLEPGMAVTAEIKTSRRRVLDYLLSPLEQYGHDSLRDR